MRRALLMSLAACGVLAAQGLIPITLQPSLPAALGEYLGLDREQIAAIARLNLELSRFQAGKAVRSAQVQRELSEHTARPTPDPLELGLRYVELEAIRRELEAEQKKTLAEAQKLLTAPQRAKLATLEEALRLHGRACEAVAAHLLTPPPTQVERWFDTDAFAATGGSAICPVGNLVRILTPQRQ